MSQSTQISTPDGISWNVTQSGSGSKHLILIPSGEGDSDCFLALLPLLPNFHITTFDMPGFSRSPCPSSALSDLSPQKIAAQIILLMDELSIPSFYIYGSSSGGNIALALLQDYPHRVEKIMVHEVPMHVIPQIYEWVSRPESEDPKTVATCQHIFAHLMNEDLAAWEALGAAYHKRLEKNYITWARNYAGVVEKSRWDKGWFRSNKERIFWTLGGGMPMSWFWENVVFCTETEVGFKVLECRHFPQVSVLGLLAGYLEECFV